jgi:TIR domain
MFISYSRKDLEFVEKLVYIARQKYAVFWDHDLLMGTQFKNELSFEIARTPAFVVMRSNSASQSDWVKREYQAAIQSKRLILPVLLDNTPLPTELSDFNALNLSLHDVENGASTFSKFLQDATLQINNYRRRKYSSNKEFVYGALASLAAMMLVSYGTVLLTDHQSPIREIDVSLPPPVDAATTPDAVNSLPQPATCNAPQQSATCNSLRPPIQFNPENFHNGIDYILGIEGTFVDVDRGLDMLDVRLKTESEINSIALNIKNGRLLSLGGGGDG